jgi:hypothetical protein
MNTMIRESDIRQLTVDELDAVSGGCYTTCGHGGTTTSKGWVADTVAAVQTIVYGHPV